ncbi:hypothetical protein WH47_11100 [Habropoda laboriosa]|uniref:Uncharacterized protein n=1 Tax=Habropoda laboriosa TaxID=597456 RepID=A0A0L7RA38_9HYME|nr:hypothetical protein WH47_11100 [Habropoda laboriosa]
MRRGPYVGLTLAANGFPMPRMIFLISGHGFWYKAMKKNMNRLVRERWPNSTPESQLNNPKHQHDDSASPFTHSRTDAPNASPWTIKPDGWAPVTGVNLPPNSHSQTTEESFNEFMLVEQVKHSLYLSDLCTHPVSNNFQAELFLREKSPEVGDEEEEKEGEEIKGLSRLSKRNSRHKSDEASTYPWNTKQKKNRERSSHPPLEDLRAADYFPIIYPAGVVKGGEGGGGFPATGASGARD